MKSKERSIFVCSSCGGEHLTWAGKCNFCDEWNTLKELKTQSSNVKNGKTAEKAEPIKLDQVKGQEKSRIKTGISEMDLVLGGGLVPGSVLLLGGSPGVGKSTLVWQIASNLSGEVVYVAAEESPEQIKLRAKRLGKNSKNITIFDNPNVTSWLQQIEQKPPSLLVIDSIQTIFDDSYPGSSGGLIQVKECALKIIRSAKKYHFATIIIGHVTKDGEVAGPKTLEHIVDGVFYLEGEKGMTERFLRSQKNRFGPTDEVGIFKLTNEGMSEALDFGRLSPEKQLPVGVARTAVLEGSRVYFVEVQSLVQKAQYGFAKRNSVGYDFNRLQMMVAILSRHTKINLQDYDVYINISDGYRLKDPIGDLAVLASLSSSFFNKPLSGKNLCLGEVDLAGRVHLGEGAKKILKSGQKIGYKTIAPSGDLESLIKKYF